MSPRLHPSPLLLLAVLLLSWGQAHADALFPGTAVGQLRRLQELEGLLHSDCGLPFDQRWKYEKAEKEISTRPEYKPLLLAQLHEEYFEARKTAGQKFSTEAISFLALRKDLTPAEQKIITDELERLSSAPGDIDFVNPAIHLLEHYPSPDHEELILRFLRQDGWPVHTLLSAFKVLYESGTEKSLPVMREALARNRVANPKLIYLEELSQYLEGLQFRLENPVAFAARAKAARKKVAK